MADGTGKRIAPDGAPLLVYGGIPQAWWSIPPISPPCTPRRPLAYSEAPSRRDTECHRRRIARENLNIERRALGPEDEETLPTMARLADSLEMQGYYAKADGMVRNIVVVERRTIGRKCVGQVAE
jgi:hypothetical protein